jgi:hypothetical protein
VGEEDVGNYAGTNHGLSEYKELLLASDTTLMLVGSCIYAVTSALYFESGGKWNDGGDIRISPPSDLPASKLSRLAPTSLDTSYSVFAY